MEFSCEQTQFLFALRVIHQNALRSNKCVQCVFMLINHLQSCILLHVKPWSDVCFRAVVFLPAFHIPARYCTPWNITTMDQFNSVTPLAQLCIPSTVHTCASMDIIMDVHKASKNTASKHQKILVVKQPVALTSMVSY